jgi:hypothetical protein
MAIPTDSLNPFHDQLLNVTEGCSLPPWILGRQFEGVVSSLDGMERCGRVERRQQIRELRRRAKRVSTALHEQDRASYRREVSISTDGRFPRRVQRITE